jgi:hypothetical protein
MVAFWGLPGSNEPSPNTPITFLGADGRWRKISMLDLGGQKGYLSADTGSLSPDGSRWVTAAAGWNVMLNFDTGAVVRLFRGAFPMYPSWSPDSSHIAFWSITRPGISVFDRQGKSVTELTLHPGRRGVFLDDRLGVTLTSLRRSGRRAAILLRSYDSSGKSLKTWKCRLPSGFDPRSTGVDAIHDGRLWVSGSAPGRPGVYRYAELDVHRRHTIQDFLFVGRHAYIAQVFPRTGNYVTGLDAAPTKLYAVDPETGTVTPLTQMHPFTRQSGYENHSTAVFAQNVFSSVE